MLKKCKINKVNTKAKGSKHRRVLISTLAGTLIAIVVLGAACSGGNKTSPSSYKEVGSYDYTSDTAAGLSASAPVTKDTVSFDEAPCEEAAADEAYCDEIIDIEYADPGADGQIGLEEVKLEDRKLITTFELCLSTEDYEKTMDLIRQKVIASGGYISAENESSYGDLTHHNYLTLKVPSAKANDYIDALEEYGTITSRSQSSEDVTLQSVDIDSHIRVLKEEHEAMEKMLENASTVEELISIQDRLTQLNYEIQSYDSQKRVMDNQVEYTAIYLTVDEVSVAPATDDSIGAQIKQKFRDSVYNLSYAGASFIIFVIGNIIDLVIVAVVIIVAVLVIKKLRKRHKARKQISVNQDIPADEDDNE